MRSAAAAADVEIQSPPWPGSPCNFVGFFRENGLDSRRKLGAFWPPRRILATEARAGRGGWQQGLQRADLTQRPRIERGNCVIIK